MQTDFLLQNLVLKVTNMLNTPQYIFVHHTGGTDKDPFADTSHHTFEGVKNYHLSLGWQDIGYHYFIEKDGTVHTGRP